MAQIKEHTLDEKLPLAQPEEQGGCRGNAASEEDGEGVDEVDWGTTTEAELHETPPHAGVLPNTLHTKILKISAWPARFGIPQMRKKER